MSKQKKIFLVVALAFSVVNAPSNSLTAEPSGAKQGIHIFSGNRPTAVQFLSQTYVIDRKYKSMEGPAGLQQVTLLPDSEASELCWITSFRTQIVAEDGQTPMSPEFMCHINLDYKPLEHGKLMGWKPRIATDRLFTLSQGAFMLEFPEGFGVPILSNEPLNLATQVLNHNFTDNPHFKVKHKVTIEFTRDRDLKIPLKPLFSLAAFQMVILEGKDGYWGIDNPNESEHGASCLPGIGAPAGKLSFYTDNHGRKFSGHWIVKPDGPEVNKFNITKLISLPFDSTLHYANIHLHPFAESFELRDITANKTIFKAICKNPKGRIGIDNVDYFSSKEGVPLYKDHQYETISVYNNTSGVDQDAMATFFLYIEDKEFKKPDLPTVKRTARKANGLEQIQMTSATIAVDKKYGTLGEPSITNLTLLPSDEPPELLWITGAETGLVGENGSGAMPTDYMGYVLIDLDPARHGQLAGWEKTVFNGRLFILSQGNLSDNLPEGFGIPIYSNEPLKISAAVMNLGRNKPAKVKHEVTVRFVRDRNLKKPLKPVFPLSPFSLKTEYDRDSYWGLEETTPPPSKYGTGSPPGKRIEGQDFLVDPFGRKFFGVWILPPGREKISSYTTRLLNVPYNTTIHFSSAYLLAFGESIELRDLTANKTVVKMTGTSFKNETGVKKMKDISSKPGIPLYKDHEYELISVYNNTSPTDKSALGAIFLYVADKEFDKTALKKH